MKPVAGPLRRLILPFMQPLGQALVLDCVACAECLGPDWAERVFEILTTSCEPKRGMPDATRAVVFGRSEETKRWHVAFGGISPMKRRVFASRLKNFVLSMGMSKWCLAWGCEPVSPREVLVIY